MEHVIFLAIVFFFFLILFVRIYLGYLFAKRKGIFWPHIKVHIPPEGIYFRPYKYMGVFFILCACTYVIGASIGYSRLSKRPDPHMAILVLDSIVPVALVFLWTGLEALSSHLFITQEGVHRKTLFTKNYYSKESIQNIYRDSEFIFIVIENKRMPLCIDKLYNLDKVSAALCAEGDSTKEEF